MRVSTAQIYTQGLRAFGDQQAKLSQLQQQISTGRRLTTPSVDPAASARALELEQTIELNNQYQVNINLAENRLSLEESALTSVENVLLRLRELALQGNNATMDSASRNALAFEVDELREQLISLGNTIDANGDFLFAGHQSQTRPFTDATTGSIRHVNFNGDTGQRLVNISESRQMNIDSPGRALFMEISSSIALNENASTANTGSGVLAPAYVFDASVYTPGDYQIVFTSGTTYDVIDVNGVVGPPTGTNTAGQTVASGTYSAGQDIDFVGIRTSITGAPAVGDTFNISQGQYIDIFSIADNLSETLRSGLPGAQIAANFAQHITDIDATFNDIIQARTSIGGRLNALEAQHEDNEALIVATQATLGKLRDTDLAEAISQLTLEQTTLDAAQAVFARITSSSLFNFLR